jgi:hypothetical protein
MLSDILSKYTYYPIILVSTPISLSNCILFKENAE